MWNVFYRGRINREASEPAPAVADSDNPTLSVLIEQGEAAMDKRDYVNAKVLFETALKLMKDDASNNPYLIQRLAYATYKAKIPDVITALEEAMGLLSKLDIEHTNDTETVTLAGRIQKKLHEKGHGDHHLAAAIQFFERGYFLLQNRYHGINLSFLLNKRADSTLSKTNEDRIADMVWANRFRRQVLKMCERDWKEINDRKDRMELKKGTGDPANPMEYDKEEDNKQIFWILANKAECHYGLGDMEEYQKAFAKAQSVDHTEWMMKAHDDQHAKLRDLMKKYGHLLNPAWKGEE
jgi:tetratricopeptide (TPR) repeat protein